jgi:hypothetical protein
MGFTNSGGTITGGAGGFTLTGSTLIKVGSVVGSDLGTLSFTTGAFISGDAQNGGILAPGGTFTITGNGTNGVPNGVIFSGTFSSVKPVQWMLLGPGANGNNNYALVGAIASTSGQAGATVQLTVATGKGLFNGSIGLESGDTSLTTSVPEPGTLGLLGTGLLGIGGLMRRKMRIG